MATPTPAIPTFTDGTIVSQGSLNALGSNETNLYNYTMGGFRTLKPICAVRVTVGTQSIPNNTGTIVNFDVEDLDYDNMWTGSNRSTITINTAGVYRVYGQVGHVGPLAELTCAILVNGTNFTTDAVGRSNVTGNITTAGATIPLAVGAVIHLGINQVTGSAQNLFTVNGGVRMTAEWISP